jgi:hypothetical protein
MAEKRLIYFMARQVRAFRWRAGTLHADAVFANTDEGTADFSMYVAQMPGAIYYVLADVVEEDFHLENIPYVRGKDRRTLLARRLAQRYRDLSLALTLSLGYETGPRKEERILFSSFTNTQQFQPWMAALRTHKARLAGVYSVPLITPLVGRRIGINEKYYLLVSRQTAGMRQSFIDNGRIRFSRLGQIEGDSMDERAKNVSAEALRVQQYLVNTNMLPRNVGPLPVVVMTQQQNRPAFQAACIDNAMTRFRLFDMEEAFKRAGLKSAPDDMLTERLYLQVLATTQPAEQFAEPALRRFYSLWRARVALVAAGSAVFGLCLLFSALNLMDMLDVKQQTNVDATSERSLSEQYARLQTQFPKTPTTPDNLKLLVANYRALQRQHGSLEQMFGEVSRALESSPQIEVEKIEWQVGVSPRRPGSATAGASAPGAPAAPPAAPPPGSKTADQDYQVVELAGRVNVVQASDYRNITTTVNQFVEALRRRPGMEVIGTQLPFDLTAEKSVSGDIGAERVAEVPRFTVVVAKRLGS